MNKKNLKILVVGVGSIGKKHIDNFKNFTKNDLYITSAILRV